MTKPKPKSEAPAGPLSKSPKEKPEPRPKPPSTLSAAAPDSSPIESESLPGDIGLDVQQPKADGVGFLGSLLSLQESGEPEAPKRGRGRPKGSGVKKAFKLEPEELANLLLVPALLMAGKKYLPEPVQPTGGEALGFCGPLARIIARHMPAVPMNEDAIDLGRMVLAGMSWWMRIQPILSELQAANTSSAGKPKAPVKPAPKEGPDNGRETQPDKSTTEVITGTAGRSGLYAGSSGEADGSSGQAAAAI